MVTNNSWNSQDPAQVAKGGTGLASTTAYAVLCGGTTTTAALQPIASVGTSGQVLTSNGAAALPTFQAVAGGGGLVFLSSATAADTSVSVEFTSGIDSTYNSYLFIFDQIKPASDGDTLRVQTSTDGGSTYDSTSGDYGYSVQHFTSSRATSINASATLLLMNSSMGNLASEAVSGKLVLYNPSVAKNTQMDFCISYGSTAGVLTQSTGILKRNAAEDVNAVKFYFSIGNIESGTFSLYGMTTPS